MSKRSKALRSAMRLKDHVETTKPDQGVRIENLDQFLQELINEAAEKAGVMPNLLPLDMAAVPPWFVKHSAGSVVKDYAAWEVWRTQQILIADVSFIPEINEDTGKFKIEFQSAYSELRLVAAISSYAGILVGSENGTEEYSAIVAANAPYHFQSILDMGYGMYLDRLQRQKKAARENTVYTDWSKFLKNYFDRLSVLIARDVIAIVIEELNTYAQCRKKYESAMRSLPNAQDREKALKKARDSENAMEDSVYQIQRLCANIRVVKQSVVDSAIPLLEQTETETETETETTETTETETETETETTETTETETETTETETE